MKFKHFQPSFIIQPSLSRREQPCVLTTEADDVESSLQFNAETKLFIILFL